MSTAYNVPQLEKKPTEVVQRPARGYLLQVLLLLLYHRSHDLAMYVII